MRSGGPRYLLICNTSDGLVAQLNGVVVQLQFARRMGLKPIVYLHNNSFMFGGPNPYFEADQGPNVWDYFFEPIGPSQAELSALIKEGKVFTLSTISELTHLYRWDPESWYMNPFGYFRSVENYADGAYPAAWWQAQRDRVRLFLEDGTVRFRPAIVDQVNMFVEKNFSEETLGLQLRGSDKFDFGAGPNLSRKVLPEEYFPYIDRYLADHPKCTHIFVATDQRQWLKVLEAAYPGKILSFSQWSLSDDEGNRFMDAQQKAARGAEVLVDLLLLSHCSYLIKCHAAVGEMALALNPDLQFLDMNYELQPFQARSRLRRRLVGPGIKTLCALWKTLSESGMSLAQVVSVEGDHILVDPARPRELNTNPDPYHPQPSKSPLLSRRFVSDSIRWILQALGNQCFAYEKRPSRQP